MPNIYSIAAMLLVLDAVWIVQACPLNPCDVVQPEITQRSILALGKEPMKSIVKAYRIFTPVNSSECFLNLTAVTEDVPQTDVVILWLIIGCQSATRVHLVGKEVNKLYNVISYLQVHFCVIARSDIDYYGRVTDLRVINLFSAPISTDENTCSDSVIYNVTQDRCLGLSSFVSLAMDDYMTSDLDLEFLFSCQTFPQVAEVILSKMSLSTLPESLNKLFPNLQSLEVSYNNFTQPPVFPWADGEMKLPRNLSRTDYLQHHYSVSYHLNIPANIFRRVLRLDYNNITNLSEHGFNGFLHMITLKGNQLQSVSEKTFSNVSGVQTIDLSYNILTNIPDTLFKRLWTLHHLDLRMNSIVKLSTRTFDDLQALKYINLASNSLTEIQRDLFTKLSNVEEIHLEFNNISVVSNKAFPSHTTHLKKLYLNNNPISVVPQVIFLIRGVQLVDLKRTHITLSDLPRLLEDINVVSLIESVIESSSSTTRDIKKPPDTSRIIDFSNCDIKRIDIANVSSKGRHKLCILLKQFVFILDGNPLHCDCTNVPFVDLVQRMRANGTFTGEENMFTQWRCIRPEELIGRPMLGVNTTETYCLTELSRCPKTCTCHQRTALNITIVDCRRRSLTAMPVSMPDGRLDLWFQYNNISSLDFRPYLRRVRQLRLSHNAIRTVESKALLDLDDLEQLFLDSNLLFGLPPEIGDLRYPTEYLLQNNPFRCDCNTLWMKRWIMRNRKSIRDFTEIVCNSEGEEGEHVILVPDNEFICDEEFDSLRHVVIPAVTCSLTVVALIVAIMLTYIFRVDIKVLIYLYLGAHPFDRDKSPDSEIIDVVVIHANALTDWVMDNVVGPLEQQYNAIVVCEVMRDFVAGFSFQENITYAVRHSKRMILCLSPGWEDEPFLCKIAWHAACEKTKESRTNYVIIISHELSDKDIEDKELQRYITRGRYIDTSKRLFMGKLLYGMPTSTANTTSSLRTLLDVMRNEICVSNVSTLSVVCDGILSNMATLKGARDGFLSYADKDLNFIISSLMPKLESRGFSLCIPDRDFFAGAAKEENILNAINSCKHTLFVFSGAHVQDEWSLFTFRAASEKSLRDKSNHLLVILLEDARSCIADEEVKYYLNSHVCLDITDRWFWQRLYKLMSSSSSVPHQTSSNEYSEHQTSRNICSEHQTSGSGCSERSFQNGAYVNGSCEITRL